MKSLKPAERTGLRPTITHIEKQLTLARNAIRGVRSIQTDRATAKIETAGALLQKYELPRISAVERIAALKGAGPRRIDSAYRKIVGEVVELARNDVRFLCIAAERDLLAASGRELPLTSFHHPKVLPIIARQSPAISRFLFQLTREVVVAARAAGAISNIGIQTLESEQWKKAMGSKESEISRHTMRHARTILRKLGVIEADLSAGDSNPTYGLGEIGELLFQKPRSAKRSTARG